MLKPVLIFIVSLAMPLLAQQTGQKPEEPSGQPKIKLNYLNVCTPSEEEQGLIRSALAKIPLKPEFAEDFEISRGRSTVKDSAPSKFVRLRRDFAGQSTPLMVAQYSMSTDEKATTEIFVARARDTKDFLEISIEDHVSSGAASPVTVAATDTPAERVRIERLGKGSIVLSRCEGADQSKYEPLFRQASEIMALYRKALGLRGAFRTDIAWLAAGHHESTPPAPEAPQK